MFHRGFATHNERPRRPGGWRMQPYPHFTAACEVAFDARPAMADELLAVQTSFLRRMLGLNTRSMLVVLYSETGLWSLKYRRVALGLRYLLYVLEKRPALPYAAPAEVRALALEGQPS
ncbi:uncharacterized protein FIBRA_08710 [Fibroporia radiculosa]|uniref:Uncharacterized protein n=1 Tax=Fibroporia radiculosa TaxID=599839 RepID=J4ICI0_9APHY|nr:uncharacterized protein FIBRA_08710 [Fibroporia radiculosa]CCM06446.1 predicted protein [Fibroporia radiculosa]